MPTPDWIASAEKLAPSPKGKPGAKSKRRSIGQAAIGLGEIPAKGRSHLEAAFAKGWQHEGGPELVEELAFDSEALGGTGRKWRADFAHMASRTLIEIEGGANGGRHTRPKGFKEDCDKYLAAHLLGWRVIRLGAHQVNLPVIGRLIKSLSTLSAQNAV